MSSTIQIEREPTRDRTRTHWDTRLGVEYVEVVDEPLHVEQFRNERIRVYYVTLAPGASTLFHRHSENTLYVVIEGGVSSSEEPGRQKQRIPGVGRSLSLGAKLSLAAQRLILGQTHVPTAALVMQYHAAHPLTHRVCAAARNQRAMQLIGIEIMPHQRRSLDFVRERLAAWDMRGLPRELSDRHVSVRRVQLAPGERSARRRIGPPSLLVALKGAADWTAGGSVRAIKPGTAQWLGSRARLELVNPHPAPFEALLVTLR